MKEYDLTDEQIETIQGLNSRLVVIKNLLQELTEGNDFLYNKLIDDLAKTQQKYDGWFSDFQSKNNVLTTPQNSWNVVFDEKKIQLL